MTTNTEALLAASLTADEAVEAAVAARKDAQRKYDAADSLFAADDLDPTDAWDDLHAAAKAAYEATITADQIVVNAMVAADDARKAYEAAVAAEIDAELAEQV